MNRTVIIGGVAAVVVLLGVAAWLLIGGKSVKSTSEQLAAENAGPIALNPVTVITDHAASESPDGRTLSISFPKFDLSAKSGDTASAVFSTTWKMKLAPDERALVAVASLNGYMKSSGAAAAPAPAAPAEPAPAPTPTVSNTDGTTAAASTPPEQPATPAAAPAPVKPMAGDGIARVIVTFGTDTTITEWTDASGSGADRRVSKAAAFVGAPADYRNGSTVPVTVTVELNGGTSAETLARISTLDLRLFAESAPLTPAAPTGTEPATTDTPPATAPTEAAPTTSTAPSDSSTTTPPPADGTTPPPTTTAP